MKTKLTSFDPNQTALAGTAKALAHPARIRMLQILAECDRCITGTIVDQLPLAQATVSQHLRVLRDAQLVRGEIEGPATCYCLDRTVLAAAAESFSDLFRALGGGAPLTADAAKEAVRAKYGAIATRSGSCCGTPASTTSSCCSGAPSEAFSMAVDLYTHLPGYEPEADLGLGCGAPTRYAALAPGETVLDLGSGAGNDAFVARAEVGESGRVIGLDMTAAMVDRARTLAAARGFSNVDFVLGEIERMPIPDNSVDCILSNCVLNLVPDKSRAFAEIHRVLKPGGRFSVSDIVVGTPLPEAIRRSVELYVGCVAGAIERDRYLQLVAAAGFEQVQVRAERVIELPPNMLNATVLSVTVVGHKPVSA